MDQLGDYSELTDQGYMTGDLRVCPASFWSGAGDYVWGAPHAYRVSYDRLTLHPDFVGTYYYVGGGFGRMANPDPAKWAWDYYFRSAHVRDASRWLVTVDWLKTFDGATWAHHPDRVREKHLTNHNGWSDPDGLNSLYLDGHVRWFGTPRTDWMAYPPSGSIHLPAEGACVKGKIGRFYFDGANPSNDGWHRNVDPGAPWDEFRAVFRGPVNP
jgi:prepilin-type processing-associated H-X9-DG protein